MHGKKASLRILFRRRRSPSPSGKKLFDKLCADCHGEKGDGVSEIAATMAADEVRPPDLTDDKWDHGATDGEFFVSIRDGVGGPGAMKGLNGQTWNWPDRDVADGELHPEPQESRFARQNANADFSRREL